MKVERTGTEEDSEAVLLVTDIEDMKTPKNITAKPEAAEDRPLSEECKVKSADFNAK